MLIKKVITTNYCNNIVRICQNTLANDFPTDSTFPLASLSSPTSIYIIYNIWIELIPTARSCWCWWFHNTVSRLPSGYTWYRRLILYYNCIISLPCRGHYAGNSGSEAYGLLWQDTAPKLPAWISKASMLVSMLTFINMYSSLFLLLKTLWERINWNY